MLRSISIWLVWLSFIGYAFFFAPPNQPDTFDLILDLSTGNWQGINPLIISLFNLMGILPMIYACFLFIDGKGQKIWAWPFAITSFGVGAFALLPYLALRQPNPNWQGEKNLLLKILDSPVTGIALTVGTIVLLGFGLLYGNWTDFIQKWQTGRFIQVMSLDFGILCLFFPALIKDDLAKRGMKQNWVFWTISFIPLFGTLVYLCLRPPLPEVRVENQLT
ncbi:DUF2834 domain-containing protein [Pleurocapsales cyanobacterium LEGE 06147]|nr:DUF2834 domain-containing protein [Pleurocapsales cyanobacterium LEGE 06147]